MNVELLIQSIVGLIIILTILIVLFLLPKKLKKKKIEEEKKQQKKAEEKKQQQKEEVLTFDQLLAIVKDRSSSTEDLEKAIDQVIKYHVKIHPKMGIRAHPEFDKYVELIVHLVRHKNTNKHIILKLDRALLKNNPSYKPELNDTLSKALNARSL